MTADGIARILVIDDEPQIRKFLRISLNAYGYEVIEAVRGEDGIAQMRDREPRSRDPRSRPAGSRRPGR